MCTVYDHITSIKTLVCKRILFTFNHIVRTIMYTLILLTQRDNLLEDCLYSSWSLCLSDRRLFCFVSVIVVGVVQFLCYVRTFFVLNVSRVCNNRKHNSLRILVPWILYPFVPLLMEYFCTEFFQILWHTAVNSVFSAFIVQ